MDMHFYDLFTMYTDQDSVWEISSFQTWVRKNKLNVPVTVPVFSTFVPTNAVFLRVHSLGLLLTRNPDHVEDLLVSAPGYYAFVEAIAAHILAHSMVTGYTRLSVAGEDERIGYKFFKEVKTGLRLLEAALTLSLPSYHGAYMLFAYIGYPSITVGGADDVYEMEKKHVAYTVLRVKKNTLSVLRKPRIRHGWISTKYEESTNIYVKDFPVILELHRWSFIPGISIAPINGSLRYKRVHGRVNKKELEKYLELLRVIKDKKNKDILYSILWQGIRALHYGLIEPIWQTKSVYFWRAIESLVKFGKGKKDKVTYNEVIEYLNPILSEKEKLLLQQLKKARNSLAHQDNPKYMNAWLDHYPEIASMIKNLVRTTLNKLVSEHYSLVTLNQL